MPQPEGWDNSEGEPDQSSRLHSGEARRIIGCNWYFARVRSDWATFQQRLSGGLGFAHAQMPELLRGRMGRSGPGNHRGMVDQPPGIPEHDATGQKRAKRTGTTQTGKHDPARKIGEKI